MEKRNGNLIISAAGGTAGKDSKTYKVSLPSRWIREIGLGADARDIELSFDGNAIHISKRNLPSLPSFLDAQRRKDHDVRLFSLFDKETLCTRIGADFTEHTLCVEDQVDDYLKTAFGRNPAPSWPDFLAFLESRCIPSTRAGLRDYLEAIGVDEYDPVQIIEKTAGRMAEDQQWLRMEVIQ